MLIITIDLAVTMVINFVLISHSQPLIH